MTPCGLQAAPPNGLAGEVTACGGLCGLSRLSLCSTPPETKAKERPSGDQGKGPDGANPAKPGGAIIVYLTGSGPVNPAVADGAAALSSSLSRVQSPVTATVGATPAEVLFAGLTPGFAGLLQVDLIVPSSLAAGTYPVTIFISGEASNSPNLVVGP